MAGIQLIIWDIGGVLVRTENHKPRQRLADRYGMARGELEQIVFGGTEDNPAQLGFISYEQHWRNLTLRFGLDEKQTAAFRDQFFGGDVVDRELARVIRHLGRDHSVAALSNAFSNMRTMMKDVWKIADLFYPIIISAEVGLMKPDPAIYRLALERSGCKAEETVFIDDSAINVEAAEDIGMNGIQFLSRQQTLNELADVLGEW